ncbi:MAG: hypothetical protein EOP56_11670 [Sphingobacteriales bacterium]|nr:MAG: hypothetical protein EOP56_11670 [Sphingobacteriales bacterium]
MYTICYGVTKISEHPYIINLSEKKMVEIRGEVFIEVSENQLAPECLALIKHDDGFNIPKKVKGKIKELSTPMNIPQLLRDDYVIKAPESLISLFKQDVKEKNREDLLDKLI